MKTENIGVKNMKTYSGKTHEQVVYEAEKQQALATIAEMTAVLSSTDWYAIRYHETGKDIPAEVLSIRERNRSEISRLKTLYP